MRKRKYVQRLKPRHPRVESLKLRQARDFAELSKLAKARQVTPSEVVRWIITASDK